MSTEVTNVTIISNDNINTIISQNEVIRVVDSKEVVDLNITVYNSTYQEIFDSIDGINVDFTTTYDFISDSTKVWLNGLKLTRNVDYTETSNNTIQLVDPPSVLEFTDNLEIEYIRS